MNHEIKFMERALALAQIAASIGEVPVGAVVVLDGVIIGEGYNRREIMSSCLEHAELNAIKAASAAIGSWRLLNAVVYSTLEPCIMCAGALVHARISALVYGASDVKFGGVESLYTMANDPRLNHQFSVEAGVMASESAQLLKDFFGDLRARNRGF